MKGGANFSPQVLDVKIEGRHAGHTTGIYLIRTLAGMSQPSDSGFDRRTSEIYVSPRRMLLIEEPYFPDKHPEAGNLHAMLITLPETTGRPTYDYFPNNPHTNVFITNAGNLRTAIESGKAPFAMDTHPIVEYGAVSATTRVGQLKAADEATKNLPEVVQQRIAHMAGLTSAEKTTLPAAMAPLATKMPAEARDDAIIDAGVAWVKAWNAEHEAMLAESQKHSKENKQALTAASKAQKAAQKAFDAAKAGAGSSSSSSGPAAAGAPQDGKARRKKTRRSSKKFRFTRRR